MDTRLAIALARRVDGERLNVTALVAELGVSRASFYVYERRFAEEGLAGLVPRSRAPRRHPNQTPVEVEDLIERWWHKLRSEGMDHGARSIWARMRRHGEDPPSARTVHRILVRRGLAKPEPKKRPRKSFRRFTAAQPNGIWQIDGLETQLSEGTKQVIIRVLDDHSRKILATVVAGEENGRDAWACLEQAIERHDPPAMFLSDNGLALDRKGKLVLVERNLRELGVSVVAASARHPQTCGKAEREHQTFERWLAAQPAPATTEQLQRLCDVYEALYNHDRPHQSLGDGTVTPAEAYQAGVKALPATEPLTQPPRITRVKVTARGEVSVGSRIRIQIGRGWEGAVLDVIRDGNVVALFHNKELIDTRIIDPTRRYQPSKHGRDGHRLPPRRQRTLSTK